MMWSEPFLVKTRDGQEVAVLLMDTQGAFDSKQTVGESAKLFALSTMTSSVQIYNLFHNIQEDDLQNLELFTDYGRLALKDFDEAPFQRLIFLVRDWSYLHEYEFGSSGGNAFLDSKLKVDRRQPFEVQRVRKFIRSSFDRVDCFLMPHPGDTVAKNQTFQGDLNDVDHIFLEQVEQFVPFLLGRKNVVPKKVNGQAVTGKQLLELFTRYADVFGEGSLPEPKSLLEATAQVSNSMAVSAAAELYRAKMEGSFGKNVSVCHFSENLIRQHEAYLAEATGLFNNTRKMGPDTLIEPFRIQLISEIEHSLKYYASLNRLKCSILEQARTSVDIKKQLEDLSLKYKNLQTIHTGEEGMAITAARRHYMSKMEDKAGRLSPSIDSLVLEQLNDQYYEEAVQIFRNLTLNENQSKEASEDLLKSDISKLFEYHKSQNDLKIVLEKHTLNNQVIRKQITDMAEQHEDLQFGLEVMQKSLEKNRDDGMMSFVMKFVAEWSGGIIQILSDKYGVGNIIGTSKDESLPFVLERVD
ncbi:Atlastin-2 [Halotydeus destructor]|nr:Atlastin-2 [Halotydeus destructor]